MAAPLNVGGPGDRPLEAAAMAQLVLEMLRAARTGFANMDQGAFDAADRLGAQIHDQEKRFMARVAPPLPGLAAPVPGVGAAEAPHESLFIPMHLERVGDNLEAFGRTVRKKMIREGVLFTPRARDEMTGLLDLAIELVECIHDALVTGSRTLVRHVLDQGAVFERRAADCESYHERRVIEGACVPSASSVYLAMLDDLKGVEWHVRQVGLKLSARLLGGPAESSANHPAASA